ncbi:MAG: hypothetical protein MZV64_58760 [Ignavibacteriales bacterium]|nr:hypothetical protein [Ignavibacteriales bacterium]
MPRPSIWRWRRRNQKHAATTPNSSAQDPTTPELLPRSRRKAAGLKMYLDSTFGELRLDDMTLWMPHFDKLPEDLAHRPALRNHGPWRQGFYSPRSTTVPFTSRTSRSKKKFCSSKPPRNAASK